MNPSTPTTPVAPSATPSPGIPAAQRPLISGIALILIGTLLLIGQFLRGDYLASLILLTLAVVFTLWGVFTKNVGLMVPGGILGGISLGLALQQAVPIANDGGLFLIGFAVGWFAIIGFTAVFAGKPQWWAAIPGTVLAVVGMSNLANVNLEPFGTVIRLWPLLLIVIGGVILWRSLRAR